MAKYLVAWSGGLDSTYLIFHLLQQGHSVEAVYVELKNNEYKVKCELKAIEKITELLTEICISRKWDFRYKGIATKIDAVYCTNLSFKQYPMWLLGLLSAVQDYTDYVAIGYVMNDDAISYLCDFKNIWDSYKPIVHKHVDLVFPLSKHKKIEMYYDIPYNIRELLWVCEQPAVDKPCGDCDPCKRAMREYNPGNIKAPVKTHVENLELQSFYPGDDYHI